ncbi:MAG: class I SAM-dependent methyltransferase [Acidimicrobiales bacterium]
MLDTLRDRRQQLHERRRRERAEAELRSYLIARGGNFVQRVEPGPPWTRDLVLQTAVQTESRVPILLNPDRYFASGSEMLLRYLRVAEAHGFNVRTTRAVLEFGCGSARIIRHLRAMTGIRLVGSDINPDSTAWCRDNVPGIEFYRNGLEPPLDFAKDDTFDLVIASSVFTHIPLDNQGPWLGEISRIVRPGGYFLCTVEGQVKERQMLTDEQLRELKERGELCLDSTTANVSVSTRVTGTWDVFQARPRVLAAFAEHFDVIDYLPGNQDLVVARAPLEHFDGPNWPPSVAPSSSDAARANWV